MIVQWKGRTEACQYRGVTLHGKTEVTREWFEACKNPAIAEVRRGRPKKETKPEVDIYGDDD